MNRLWQLAPVSLLCACSGIGGLFEEPPPTLADLQPVELPEDTQAPPRVSLDELASIYRVVLEQQQEPQTRLQVSHRLADIQMLGAEEQLALEENADTDLSTGFAGAIENYESLLRNNPDYPRSDQVLYQLSKAFALSGQLAESQVALVRLGEIAPHSPYLAEAYFRQAEGQFVDADYAQAEQLYAQVIDYGEQTPYFTRALYMQGWSRFKQDRYDTAIAAFTASLDQLLPTDKEVEKLPRGDRELVNDSLRVMAIVFSKRNGADTLAGTYDALGVRHYEHLLYDALGTLYLSQERYDDSALTYQAFIARWPESRRAHHFQVRVIETYEAGGFEELIVSAKQDYVAAFSVSGDYWQHSDSAAQDAMNTRLQVFIPELARHHHALAQASIEAKAKAKPAASATAEAAPHYAQAAHYYQLYLDSFPQDPQVPELTFLLAESQYEAGNYLAAIDAYETVAYSYNDSDTFEASKAADAGYTAILAFDKLATQTTADPQVLQRWRVESELRFQATFPGDSRATSVLGHAATALLELQDYAGALAAASTLAAQEPAPNADLLIPAWLVIGHSQFALEQFPEAESAYREGLTLLPQNDERRQATNERLAATLYRQGELAADLGDDGAAAQHFQRAMVAAPASIIGVSAQYDAAQALIRAGELEQASTLLRNFRQRHPDHELTAGIGALLLANYEQLQQWHNAAIELDTLRGNELDKGASRQAHIVAARYYDKSGDSKTAIDRYRSYAHAWPDPVEDNIEVAQRLSELYLEGGDSEKRRYWLRRIMAVHDGAGTQQSDRSRYLAAQSASIVADETYITFTRLPLAHPIKKTLPAKKQAMEQALSAFQRCNRYAVEQFISQCSYHLGDVYQRFSADLMNSGRPPGLDALALEQYEIMLEEQAFPFEEKAIAIHESNARRAREGLYDQWVQRSFTSLASLLPARYNKTEVSTAEQLPSPLPETLDITPRKLQALNSEAIEQRKAGNFDRAEEIYIEALARREEDAVSHRNLGILYDLYLGIPEAALYHYQRYQALTGDGDRAMALWIVDLERRNVQLAKENL